MLPKATAMKATAMKAMKKSGRPMTKTAIAGAIATAMDVKKKQASKFLNSLAEIGTNETVSKGKFTLPGLVMIKTKVKPARQAGVRKMFGKEVSVKAQAAK